MTNYAEKFIDFLNEAIGSPYTTSLAVKRRLLEAGYVELKENELWTLETEKKYFIVRDEVAIVAFRTNKATETARFVMAGSHLDYPYLKVKPHGGSVSQELAMVSCEVYGGGIWQTWFDRDLGISGRVILKDGSSKVFKINEPLMRIATIAIHVDTDRKFSINKETHLPAICAEAKQKGMNVMKLVYKKIAESLQIDEEEIVGGDIMLYDVQPAGFMANKKYVLGQGQDNLHGAYTTLAAFLNAEEKNKEADQIDVLVCFDNEEIGSTTRRGAHSVFVPQTVERIHSALFPEAGPQALFISNSRSLVLSVDGAHATHPNIDFIEKKHPIRLNGGVVLKQNASQKYMSDDLLRALVAKAAPEVPTQVYVLIQDLIGGSTIGPHIAAFSGMTTIDMGAPMLSMHSIREMTGAKDVEYMISLVEGCYTQFPELPH